MFLFTTLPNIEEAQYIYFPDHTTRSSDDSGSDYEEPLYGPRQFNKSQLNDLIRDLYLSKDQSEFFSTRLQENKRR